MDDIQLTPHSVSNAEYHQVPANYISPKKSSTLTEESAAQSSLKGYLKIILDFIIQDIKKRPRSFKIGLFTVFLVITFIALLVNCLSVASVIFVKLSEDSVGDADMILTISSAVNDTRVTDEENQNSALMRLLNHNQIQTAAMSIDQIVGCSPRWLLFAQALNPENINKNIRSYLLIYNASQERSIGLGRNLDTPILGKFEVIVTQSVLDIIGIEDVTPNETTIYLNLDIISELLDSDMIDLTNLFNDSTTNSTEPREILAEQIRNQFIQAFEQNTNQTIDDLENLNVDTRPLKDSMEQIDPVLDLAETSPVAVPVNTAIAGILAQAGLPTDSPLYDSLTDQDNQQDTISQLRDFSDFVKTLDDEVTINASEIIEFMVEATLTAQNLTFELRIMKVVDSPEGKWPSLLGNLIGLEQEYLLEMITDAFFQNFQKFLIFAFIRFLLLRLLVERAEADQQFALFTNLFDIVSLQQMLEDQISEFDLNEMVMLEWFVIKNRMPFYSSSTKSMNRQLISLTDSLTEALGTDNPSDFTVPLANAIQQISIMQSFLSSIFYTSLALLALLSILLIYSLMLSDVEEKTYEYGMLRALGFNHKALIILLTIQGLIFALGGTFLGIILAYILSNVVCNILFLQTLEKTSYWISNLALIVSIIIGLFIPIISNIAPIQRALSKTLRDSLDLYHRTINEFKVEIQKLEKLGLSPGQLLSASTLVAIGIITYYFAPYAFMYNNISLFLMILNLIFILLVIGVTLLVSLAQNKFQQLIIWVILVIARKDRPLGSVIFKNMSAHKSRNTKTSLMFSLAISFILFSATGIANQMKAIQITLESNVGSDILVYCLDSYEQGLDEQSLRDFFKEYSQIHPNHLASYTFMSMPYKKIPGLQKKVYLSPLSDFPYSATRLIGIEENYMQSVDQSYYQPREYDESISYPELSDGKRNGIAGLFTNEAIPEFYYGADTVNLTSNEELIKYYSGQSNPDEKESVLRIAIAEGLRLPLSLSCDTPATIEVYGLKYRTRIRHMAAKIPGVFFSSYQTIMMFDTTLISMEQLSYLVYNIRERTYFNDIEIQEIKAAQALWPNSLTYDIPKQQLLVKYGKDLTDKEKTELLNGIRNYLDSDLIQLFEVESAIKGTDQAFKLINLFYIIIAVVTIILTFFLILVSFITNVKENQWEFGILRAIGLNKSQMTRIYIYEAIALLLAAAILGSFVGIIIALTMVIQYSSFTEQPLSFYFPIEIFLITFCLGIFTAIFASYFALRQMREKPISTIIKGL